MEGMISKLKTLNSKINMLDEHGIREALKIFDKKEE